MYPAHYWVLCHKIFRDSNLAGWFPSWIWISEHFITQNSLVASTVLSSPSMSVCVGMSRNATNTACVEIVISPGGSLVLSISMATTLMQSSQMGQSRMSVLLPKEITLMHCRSSFLQLHHSCVVQHNVWGTRQYYWCTLASECLILII